MASLSALRDAIKTRLDTVAGLRAHDTIPPNPQPPAAMVGLDDPAVTYDETYGGGAKWHLKVRLLVSRASEEHGQDKLDGYISDTGSSSIKAAIEGAAATGWDWVLVREVRNYGEFVVAEIPYIGCDFIVEGVTS